MNWNLSLRTSGLLLALAVITISRLPPLAAQGPPDHDAVLAQLKQTLSDAGGDVTFADPEKSYAVSPDGRYFAGTLKSKGETVSVVFDLQQKRTLIYLGGVTIESPVFSPGTKWVAFVPPGGAEKNPIAVVVDHASGQLTTADMNAPDEQQGPPRWRDATTLEFSYQTTSQGPGPCVWEVDRQAGKCGELPLVIKTIDVQRTIVAADEASAVALLRTVNTAAVTYATIYNVGYPKSLAAMGESSDGTVTQEHAGLIDNTLVSGKKTGYTFTYWPGPVVDGRIDTYTVVARPVQYGKSGSRSFFTDQSGVIRETKEDRESTVNDPPSGG